MSATYPDKDAATVKFAAELQDLADKARAARRIAEISSPDDDLVRAIKLCCLELAIKSGPAGQDPAAIFARAETYARYVLGSGGD